MAAAPPPARRGTAFDRSDVKRSVWASCPKGKRAQRRRREPQYCVSGWQVKCIELKPEKNGHSRLNSCARKRFFRLRGSDDFGVAGGNPAGLAVERDLIPQYAAAVTGLLTQILRIVAFL